MQDDVSDCEKWRHRTDKLRCSFQGFPIKTITVITKRHAEHAANHTEHHISSGRFTLPFWYNQLKGVRSGKPQIQVPDSFSAVLRHTSRVVVGT